MADMEKLEQRISELERRIQMQEDIRAIERLQANYWDCLDKKDWDGLRACFTDDFVFINNTTGGRYVGGDGMLATMKGKFTNNVTSSHHGHHHWVEITGEDTALAHWALEDDLYDAVNEPTTTTSISRSMGAGMPPKWLSPIFAVRATSRRDLRTARTHMRFSLCDSRNRITKMECILK